MCPQIFCSQSTINTLHANYILADEGRKIVVNTADFQVKNALVAGISPRTLLEKLRALPRSPSWIWERATDEGKGGERREPNQVRKQLRVASPGSGAIGVQMYMKLFVAK